MTIELYKKMEKLEIPVNNNNYLQVELVKTDKKFNNQYLKITRINEHGNKEQTEFISEGDFVLLWNLYLYKKTRNEEIF